MQNRYLVFWLINAALTLSIATSSCSKNAEDIAAPSITITKPTENDTIQLKNGVITIELLAKDRVRINDMEMSIEDKLGTVLYTYDKDDIEDISYTCHELFSPIGLTKVTQMKLTATFSNEYKNWITKRITFYVKP